MIGLEFVSFLKTVFRAVSVAAERVFSTCSIVTVSRLLQFTFSDLKKEKKKLCPLKTLCFLFGQTVSLIKTTYSSLTASYASNYVRHTIHWNNWWKILSDSQRGLHRFSIVQTHDGEFTIKVNAVGTQMSSLILRILYQEKRRLYYPKCNSTADSSAWDSGVYCE